MGIEQQEVFILLYRDIKNMNELRELLLKGELKAAIVNTELVYNVDQLVLASHKSLYNAKNRQLKTKTIYTELLYNLFPTRSIRDSLKTFGAQDTATSAIFVLYDTESLAELKRVVKGRSVDLATITKLRDVESIRKVYKIPSCLTEEESVLEYIISKISTKELLY